MVQYIIPHCASRPVKVNGRLIGCFKGNTFYKTAIGSKHQLKKPPAWAIDAEVFDKEIKPNASQIVILDKETGIEYHTSVDNFDRLKGGLDRGFGRQYYLKLNHWQIREHNNQQFSFLEGEKNDK